MVDPIRLHLQQNNLTSTIRYIVICRGVPYKIQAAGDWSVPGNISVDGLLCMFNTQNYEGFVGTIFNTYTAQCYFNPCDSNATPCYGHASISNPYFDMDTNFEMNARFLPDYYTGNWGGYNYKLSYLVSRLDGLSFDIIKDIIDKSVDADQTGNKTWILDARGSGGGISQAFIKLNDLGFTTEYDENIENWITTSLDSVIGYTSDGVHQGMPPTYIQDTLDFNYANGAVFNTYESYNGFSIGTLRRAGQGLMTEFLLTGGTGGAGHGVWEPYSGAVKSDIYFPYYAIGYNQIDAAWQSLDALAWRSVFVGDPLTRIYNCENTVITTNTTIGSGDYQCSMIVPQNVILTISPGSTINFNRNASLKVYGTLVISSSDTLNFNSYSKLVIYNDNSLNINSGSSLNFNQRSIFQIKGSIVLNGNNQINLNDKSLLDLEGDLVVQNEINTNNESIIKNNGNLVFNSGGSLNINNSSSLFSYGKLQLNEGVVINQNYSNPNSFISIEGVFKSSGTTNNPVILNCSSNPAASKLYFNNLDTLIFSYTKIDSGHIVFDINDGEQKPRLYSISNTVITNSASINIFSTSNTEGVNITLSDNSISSNNAHGIGMTFSGFNSVQIVRSNYENIGSVSNVGIGILDNKFVEIKNCQIIRFKDGVKQGRIGIDEIDITNNEDIRVFNSDIIGIGFDQAGTGISIGYTESITSGVKIDQNNISGFSYGITINNDDNFALGINNNTITNYGSFGVSFSNGSEAVIKENIITADASTTEHCVGISVNQVSNPSILGNTIDADSVSSPGSGISLVSCNNGEVRLNTIQNHLHGIEIGSSSPNLAENTIMNNIYSGLYVSAGSFPNLSETTSGEYTYPLTGYNIIRENGCSGNINAEIYFDHAGANLHLGCNTLADDRENSSQCDNTLLMDGIYAEGEIVAEENYWGNHPVYGHDPSERFGNEISVIYDPYLEEPCTYSRGEEFLVLSSSNGEVIDTVYSSGIASTELTDIESRYKAANGYYYNNQYNQAKLEYEGIIQNYGNSSESIQAYNRFYTITSLTNSSPSVFNQLKNYYLQQAANQTDSLMIGTLKHLSDLCLVSEEEYLPAINNFDEIAQQNPNTDIALYRQIDALTTSLLVPQDSNLNKGVLGKYSVTNLSDYTNKLSELLKTRGKSGLDSKKELLPTEYTLYQNYPNPFNPTTTIKYDLPNTTDVSLIIYDILGRKVKELVNTRQQAGRYEVQFNASNLASGIYIYQLIAEKYISSKKMILLK